MCLACTPTRSNIKLEYNKHVFTFNMIYGSTMSWMTLFDDDEDNNIEIFMVHSQFIQCPSFHRIYMYVCYVFVNSYVEV